MILVAFDGLRFSDSALNYAVELSKNCNAHLVGIFLEDFMRHSYSIADIAEYSGASFDKHLQVLDDRDNETR